MAAALVMEGFAATLRRELAWLSGSRWDLALCTLAPFLVLVILGWMFVDSVARGLPIAYVDQDHSAISRKLERALDASPNLTIAARAPDLESVWPLMRSGKVWAVVYTPAHAEKNILAGRHATIFVYENAAFYSLGALASMGAKSAIQDVTAEIAPELLRNKALPLPRIAAPTIQSTILFNPQLSYEWFLEALLQPGVLHLMMSCVVVMAVGREFRDGTAGQWLALGPLPLVLIAKLAPYVVIFTAWHLLGIGWLCGVRGWGLHGSLSMMLAGVFLFYAAYAAVAAMIVVLVKDIATALSAAAVYGGPAITFSNATLPTIDAPLFTQVWSRVLPFTSYVELQMEQMFMGSPARDSMDALLALLGFTLVPLAVTLLMLRHARAAQPATVAT